MGAAENLTSATSLWRIERLGHVVQARFDGYLDEAAGHASAQRFESLTVGLERLEIVFDVRAMDGYDNAARNAWGRVMRKRREQIVSIETVGASPIIRLGASVLGMFAGVLVTHTR